MIPKKLHELFSEVLKEKKDENGVDVLTIVVGYEKDAEKFKADAVKFEADNKAIIEERKTLKEEKKTLTTERDTLKTENETLAKNQKSDKDKKVVEKGMSEEMEAEFNLQKQTVKELTENVKNLTTSLTTEREEKATEKLNAEESSLETDVIKALAGVKIVDQGCVSAALGQVRYDGLAKINKEEDGSYKRLIVTKAKNGDIVAADLEGLASYIAETNPRLVNSSGKTGPGVQHSRESGGLGGDNKTGITDDHSKDLSGFEAGLT